MKRPCQVALLLGSFVLSGGLAFAQAKLGPYIVDANGLKVGHAKESNTALIFIEGQPVQISAGRSGFRAQSYSLYFADGTCTSQPLLDAGGDDILIGTGRYTTDGVIRYFYPAAASVTPLQSAVTVQTDGTFSACGPASLSIAVAPALNGSALPFTPPFRVVDVLPVSAAPEIALFVDVPVDHPFFKFIEALYASGITAGCVDVPARYCPDAPVTRGQVAVFLAKALGL